MKKTISLLVILSLILTFTACSSLSTGNLFKKENESDTSAEEKLFDLMVQALSDDKPNDLYGLFAKNTAYKQENFNEDLKDLVEFFQGEFQTYKKTQTRVSDMHDERLEDKDRTQIFYRICQYNHIETDTNRYKIIIRYNIEVKGDSDYEGISWLYICEQYNDTCETYDIMNKKPGIYIANCGEELQPPTNFNVFVNKNLDSLFTALENNDNEGVKDLFSRNTVQGIENFDDDVNSLISYFNGTVNEYYETVWYKYTETEENGVIKNVVSLYYDVDTTDGIYRITLDICTNYDIPEEKGIISLYIIKAEKDMNLKIPYRGDRKGTAGINIDVSNYRNN